jgi:hypothetical protein
MWPSGVTTPGGILEPVWITPPQRSCVMERIDLTAYDRIIVACSGDAGYDLQDVSVVVWKIPPGWNIPEWEHFY